MRVLEDEKIIGLCVLSFLLASCGEADEADNEGDTSGERCVDTWWYLEQDGQIVLEGDEASFTNVPGTLYVQAYFADADPGLGQSCTFLSTKPLGEGVHDNLTCAIATAQGPNPQWIGAETSSDGDHRPALTSLSYEGDYVSGTFEGTMFRMDTLGVSPPNIVGEVVNYRFDFKALNNSYSDDEYEICSDKTCRAMENLSEIADNFISRCRKAKIRSRFPSQLYNETLKNIRNGKTADHHTARKLLNDGRFMK